MKRLASILYSMIGTTLAGSFMVAALVMGYDTLYPLLVAVAFGAIVAIPATYLISNAIVNNIQTSKKS